MPVKVLRRHILGTMVRILGGTVLALLACGASGAATASESGDTASGPEGHILACLQFCFDAKGLSAVGLQHDSTSEELKLLWSCLEPHDTARHSCSQVGTELKNKVQTCVTQCQDAGDSQHGPPKPPFADLPAASHPALLRVVEVHRRCNINDLYFSTFEYFDAEVTSTAVATLRRCGLVVLESALPEKSVSDLATHAGAFLSDRDRFLSAYYDEHVDAADVNTKRAGTPFTPNLYGGRFEVVPPVDTEVVRAHKTLALGPVADILRRTWGSEPECFIMQYMCQAKVTWDQQFHRDANSVEDVKVQVALQDYGQGEGPPQFLLGSHLQSSFGSSMRMDYFTNLFPAFAPVFVRKGAAIVYFSAVLHRGVKNTKRRLQRLSLDYVIHSTGRFFHDSERVHRSFLETSPKTRKPVLKLRKIWRQEASLLHVDTTTPLAWRVPGAFDQSSRRSVDDLVRRAETIRAREARSFGEDYGAHQTVTYLEHVLPLEILDQLWKITLEADVNARWNISKKSRYSEKKRPNVRCLEAIYYDSGEFEKGDEMKDTDQSIGWHSDGQTLFTTAVMLSTPGKDFTGGGFEIRRVNNGEPTVLSASLGDAIVWRGWYEHRVNQISSGTRRVLVVEWWTGKDVSVSGESRAGDSKEGFARARAVDSRSPYLYLLSASHLLSSGEDDASEEQLRYAIAMDPSNERVYFGLGTLMNNKGDRKGAISFLRRALKLHPLHAKSNALLGSILAAGSKDEVAEAEKHLRLATDNGLRITWVYNLLGQLVAERGAFAEAKTHFHAALKITPDSSDALDGLKGIESRLEEL
eukprot:TRINITY_DN50915_c0_g1_i1.p1 TRINITY_DN50915_c0_g1~~TRINITY_DN50915_c0_g1_i1.p1  ORF type:complete len:809 (-),score=127.27 TRINITY_DN50915_c0_g1_i1:131-2557(-)